MKISFTTIPEMLQSQDFQAFQESVLGNDLWFENPERAQRLHEYAENGSDGSTHAEMIKDWREYLSRFRDEEDESILESLHQRIDSLELMLGNRLHEVIG